jgi:U3 small nucleolar RNA-associated protein 23
MLIQFPAFEHTTQSPTQTDKMRAKRSKKYRKTMSSFQLAFGFREPYQILLDAAFIRTCHAFHMPLQKYLDNTLHGQCRIFITQCTLEKVMAAEEKATGRRRRPDFLPPPTALPLRYCKHKNDAGEDLGVLDESHCLLDLLAGQPKGNEQPKNKQHYILATADAEEREQRRKGFVDVRERARMVPGVPIVYVKRSVMILEEMSGASEMSKWGQEKEKFREGLLGKRKREDEDDELLKDLMDDAVEAPRRGLKKAKGPNPMSVMKKKVKPVQEVETTKPRKARRKRGRKKTDGADMGVPVEVEA